MTRELIAALMLAVVPLFALLSWNAVRKTRAAQEALMPQPEPSSSEGGIDCLYVSTVMRNEPLRRIWAHGLGSRGNAQVKITDGYAHLNRIGERSFSFKLDGIGLQSATIDKGVESNGLVRLDWSLCSQELSTTLRFRSPQRQLEFMKQLEYESDIN